MVGSHWFVYPVENGVELVINSTDGAIYDRALAEFVTHYLDYDLVAEWSIEGAEVLRFVPAPVNAPAIIHPDEADLPGQVPGPRSTPEAAEAR
jgi:hypothetical protein